MQKAWGTGKSEIQLLESFQELPSNGLIYAISQNNSLIGYAYTGRVFRVAREVAQPLQVMQVLIVMSTSITWSYTTLRQASNLCVYSTTRLLTGSRYAILPGWTNLRIIMDLQFYTMAVTSMQYRAPPFRPYPLFLTSKNIGHREQIARRRIRKNLPHKLAGTQNKFCSSKQQVQLSVAICFAWCFSLI